MSLLGTLTSLGSTAGLPTIPGINMGALTTSLTQAVQAKIAGPGTPIGGLLAKADNIKTQVETAKTKITDVATKIQNAPKLITNTVVAGVGAKLKNAGISTPTGQTATGQTSTGPEQLGTPPTDSDPGTDITNTPTSGGGLNHSYETVHLTRKIKHPLYVFYLDGRPIYFTQSSNDEVELIPLYSDIVISNTSARHKYTKKVKTPKRHSNHTLKHVIKGIRKVSHKTKQKHSRKSH